MQRIGARTSRIVDPRNGRIPPLSPMAEKIPAGEREFRLALLQAADKGDPLLEEDPMR
jgi:hypothetical protein